MCSPMLDVVEKTFSHTGHFVLPLWIFLWFWRDFLFENSFKRTSQENCLLQSDFQLKFSWLSQSEIRRNNEQLFSAQFAWKWWAFMWALKLETVEKFLLHSSQNVKPLWLFAWFCRAFLFEYVFPHSLQENCLEMLHPKTVSINYF